MSKSNPCEKARKQYKNGDLKGTSDSLKKCIKQVTKRYRESKGGRQEYQQQLARLHNFSGLVHLQLNQIKTSLAQFDKSLLFVKNLPSSQEISQLKGDNCYYIGLLDQNRRDMLNQSVVAYEHGNDYSASIKVMFKLAEFSTTDDKLIQYRSIQKKSKKIKDKRMKKLMEARGKLFEGKILTDHKKAENLFNDARKIYSKQKYPEGISEVLVELASLKEETSPELADEYYREALDLANTFDGDAIKGLIYTRMGILSLRNGEFNKGEQYLLKGLKFRTQAGDRVGAANTLLELSRITLISSKNKKDIEKSRELIQQSIELYNSTDDINGKAHALELFATIDTKLMNFDNAIQVARESRSIFAKLNDTSGEARSLVQLGVALSGAGVNDEVLPVLEKSMKLFESLGSLTGIAEVQYLLGLHYEKIDRNKSSLYFTESLELYKKLIDKYPDLSLMIKLLENKLTI